jgi:hypothetical protein
MACRYSIERFLRIEKTAQWQKGRCVAPKMATTSKKLRSTLGFSLIVQDGYGT